MINGATIPPIIPNPSINPAAVDWIDTTKAYVSQQATRQYPLTELFKKITCTDSCYTNKYS